MPNWCFNKLTITGKEEDLTKFKDSAKGTDTDLCLDNFVPMPKELENTRSPGPWPNWYDWRMYNWGVKWDIQAQLFAGPGNTLIYEFENPWSPPIRWLRKVALMYPILSFELYFKEPGMCFQGTIIAQADLSILEEYDYYEDYEDIDELGKYRFIDERHFYAMKDFENMRF